MNMMTQANAVKPGKTNTLKQAWLVADPRALGLFRIAFGLLCMYDVIRRLPWITTFYSNVGTLSNHYDLYAPIFRPNISLLSGFSSPVQVTCFFIFTLLCLSMFTIGYRTRLFQLLSWVCMLSIHSRNTMLANGGDVVMNIWWLWTLWLPLGIRFSVDSLRLSLASPLDRTPSNLRHAPAGPSEGIRSLAVIMVLWQLSLIYFFNSFPHKTGITWQDGTAIAYALEQDRVITPLALWARELLPLWSTQLLSWTTLVIEGLAPLLLLTPWFCSIARRIFIVCLMSLHLGIWLLMDVGLFSFSMMVSYFIILTSREIDLIKRWLTKVAGQPIRVHYDRECPFSFRLARFIARLDRLNRIQWKPVSTSSGLTNEVDSDGLNAQLEQSLFVIQIAEEDSHVGYRGTLRILSSLPLGRPLAWLAMLPFLSHTLQWLYGWVGQNRYRLCEWFGCTLESPDNLRWETTQANVQSTPGWARRLWTFGSTALILFFFSATTSQMLVENRFISKTLDIQISQPEILRKTLSTARIFQGWSMFAPNVPMRDGWLVIDAELPDGTHVDPQTGRTPEFVAANARKMQWDQFWGSYSMRIASDRFKSYRGELVTWLTNRDIARLTLPVGQRLKSLRIWWLGDASPNPKLGGPPIVDEKNLIATWPK